MNKNCIIYLLRASDEDVQLFIQSIKSLEINFLPNNPVDILCFHENDLYEYINLINKSVDILIKFHEISFEVPSYNKHLNIPNFFPHPTHGNGPIEWGHPGFPMGYRHMCRFYSGEVFNLPILKDYEYYMRMDNDSFILKNVNYNVFDYMKNNNKFYAYIAPAVQFDNPKVSEGLWEYSQQWYINNKENCILQPIVDIPKYKMYYTNFEICHLNWFKNSLYLEYYKYIDKLGGIYTNRWGDAIIRYLGVNMLMDDNNKYPIHDIAYKHGAVYNI